METARQVTERLIAYGTLLIQTGVVLDITELAKAGGMTGHQWYMVTSNPERNFTIQQLVTFGKRFNLDMNYFFFGVGEPQMKPAEKASVIELLHLAIVKLEADNHRNVRANIGINRKAKVK